MKKYRVYGHATVICSMIVEADSEEEAIETANENFGELTNYAGMGSCYCLIGVFTSDDGRCVLPGSRVKFNNCVEV